MASNSVTESQQEQNLHRHTNKSKLTLHSSKMRRCPPLWLPALLYKAPTPLLLDMLVQGKALLGKAGSMYLKPSL